VNSSPDTVRTTVSPTHKNALVHTAFAAKTSANTRFNSFVHTVKLGSGSHKFKHTHWTSHEFIGFTRIRTQPQNRYEVFDLVHKEKSLHTFTQNTNWFAPWKKAALHLIPIHSKKTSGTSHTALHKKKWKQHREGRWVKQPYQVQGLQLTFANKDTAYETNDTGHDAKKLQRVSCDIVCCSIPLAGRGHLEGKGSRRWSAPRSWWTRAGWLRTTVGTTQQRKNTGSSNTLRLQRNEHCCSTCAERTATRMKDKGGGAAMMYTSIKTIHYTWLSTLRSLSNSFPREIFDF